VIVQYIATQGQKLAMDQRYYRPAEVDFLIGDPSKAKRKLGWEAKTKFKDPVRLMVDADMETARKEAHMNSYNGSESNIRRSSQIVDQLPLS
jgi:GDPmannose 4,6-dehydratase